MLVELHCHSTCSDGSSSAAEVAALARERGVELFALTDHDSTAGWDEVRAAWPEGPVIRGLELSCVEADRTVHLLVYDVERDPARWEELEHRLVEIRSARRQRVHDIAARLWARGISLDVDAVLRLARGSSVGRPHVARALVEAGAVKTEREAFSRWLHDDGPAHVPVARLAVDDAVDLAWQAGGRISLAHPHTVGPVIAGDLVRRLRDRGLGAVEALYGLYSQRERAQWCELAAMEGLRITAGSDYHGTLLPQITRPGVEVSEGEGRRLREWLRM